MLRILAAVVLAGTACSLPAADLPPGAFARAGGVGFRHAEHPTSLAFSPDGTRLASGGTDGVLRIWDATTGAELHTITVADGSSVAIAFSGDLLAASFGDRKLRLFDTRTFRPLRALPAPDLETLTLTRDGKLVGGATTSGQVVAIESANGLERIELPTGRAFAFTPDGSAAVVSDDQDTITVFQLPSGKPLHVLRHPNRDGITSLAVSTDGTKLASADMGPTGRVRVWDLRSGEKLAEWAGEGPVAFRPANQVVSRRGGAVAVWSLTEAKLIREIDAAANLFAVSPDGRRLATAGNGTRIRLWDLATGVELHPASNITGLAPRGTSDVLVSTTEGWKSWSPAAHGGLTPTNETGPPAIVTGERTLTITDPKTGAVLRSWDAPSAVQAAAISPDGKRLTAMLRDGHVRSWDLTGTGETPREAWSARVLRGLHAEIAYPAKEGRLVAVTSMVRVTLLDAATGTRIDGFVRKLGDGPFRSVAFSPDGSLIAAGCQGSSGSITIWETATRSVVRRFTSNTGTVRHLAFRDGGRALVSVSGDDTLLAWDLSGRFGKRKPTADELYVAWNMLDRDDPAIGYPPIWTLAAGGADGVVAIRDGLARHDETLTRVKKLIGDLDARSFRVREKAGAELLGLGSHALPDLTAAAESHPSAEGRQRAADILATLKAANVTIPEHGLYGEKLRRLRAVAALEAIGGPEAAKVLEEIKKTGGQPGEEAERALRRQ